MDQSELYDEYGNYLGAVDDSDEELIQEEEQSIPSRPLHAFDDDQEPPLEALEGMEVDGKLIPRIPFEFQYLPLFPLRRFARF